MHTHLLAIRKISILLYSNNLWFSREKLSYYNGYKLYRRSKPHIVRDHWNETRLGEISVNWSFISSNAKLVRLTAINEEGLYSLKFTDVLVFNTRKYDFPELPVRVLFDDKGNKLEVLVEHDPLKFNYSHCNINCYLTTADGDYNRSLVRAGDYNTHPLKKKLRGLRNEFKAMLVYWFQEKLN